MATLKLTLDKRRGNREGKYPIVIRLTSKTKSTYIHTETRLRCNEWDISKGKVTKTHPNHESLNLHLQKKLIEFEKKLLELASQTDELNVAELKNALVNENKVTKPTFYDFATKEIQKLKDEGRYGNASVYETALRRFTGYTGRSMPLDKINYSVIADFDTHLLKEGVCRNTIAIYMREIRALLNKAIKKELLDRNKYPFRLSLKSSSRISFDSNTKFSSSSSTSKGYSQANIAEDLGITAGAYAKIEREETDASASRLLHIAQVLEVTIIEFFENNNVPSFKDKKSNYRYASREEMENLSKLVHTLIKEGS